MHFFRLFVLLSLVLFPVVAQARQSPLTCIEREKNNYFPYTVVAQAMSLNRVPQGVWRLAIADLQSKGREVPRLLRERAQRMNPNPFNPPYNDKVARELWLQMLQRIFLEVMVEYGVDNPASITNAFDYIATHHLSSFDDCFPEAFDEEEEQFLDN